jgi:hypothetical protein
VQRQLDNSVFQLPRKRVTAESFHAQLFSFVNLRVLSG